MVPTSGVRVSASFSGVVSDRLDVLQSTCTTHLIIKSRTCNYAAARHHYEARMQGLQCQCTMRHTTQAS